MTNDRLVIVGGPRCGKSWLARELRSRGYPTFCGDPRSEAKEPEAEVTYLPERLGFSSAASQYIVDHWLPMPGPWVLEGHIMARVLRKWMQAKSDIELERPGLILNDYPCERVVVFQEQRPELELLPGQVSLHRGVGTVWNEIGDYYEPITEYR